jgi:Rnl2 family RNA ligase
MNSANDFTKYQHLEALSKIQDIFLEPEVVCTEKIHGTNARVGLVEGVFRIGGRNQEHTNDMQGDSVMGFVKWVRSYEAQIQEVFKGHSVVFYGEWFGPGIQKGVVYSPDKAFRVFDVRLDGKYADWDAVVELSAKAGFITVPVLYRGFPKLEVFDRLIEMQSTVAQEFGMKVENNTHEGIVIKPSKMKVSPITGEWMIAKYKNAKFAERKSEKEKKDFKPLPGEVHKFVEEFVTDTRLEHVIDHLRDQGIEVKGMEATPHVLKEMNLDILREGASEVDKLTADETVEWKQVSKLVSARTTTLLKQYLRKLLEQAVSNQQKI